MSTKSTTALSEELMSEYSQQREQKLLHFQGTTDYLSTEPFIRIIMVLADTIESMVMVVWVAITIYLLTLLFRPIFRVILYNTIATCFAFVRWNPATWSIFLSIGIYFRSQILGIILQFKSLPTASAIFLVLFVFKFLKVIVHTISYLTYRSAVAKLRFPYDEKVISSTSSGPGAASARAPRRLYSSEDCTVIIPTVGDMTEEFEDCLQSILQCNPGHIIVSTVGKSKLVEVTEFCKEISPERITCVCVENPSKRQQVVRAVNCVQTYMTVLADDHVFWPRVFLESALAPFDDPQVGLVGTVKRVRRETKYGFFNMIDFLNYIACIYLERHNFECTASHNIDGGVFVISGRTVLARTAMLQTTDYQDGFLRERWFFGKLGPLNVDDDNFNTRYMVKHGFKVVFHNAPQALMETTLGTEGGWKKFSGQLDRWARTGWRSNSTSLFADRTIWYSQPWSVYAVFLSSFVNLALFYDPALFVSLRRSPWAALRFPIYPGHSLSSTQALGLLLLASKLIKPLPHLLRNPRDFAYLPFGLLFGYYHSIVRVKALLTCGNIAWGTRPGVDNMRVG